MSAYENRKPTKIGLKKRLVSMLASAVVIGVVIAPSPASADPFAGAMACNSQFPSFPGAGASGCTGTFIGVDAGRADARCALGCSFFWRIDQYFELCALNEPFPPFGGASGEVFIDGRSAGSFGYTRVGAVGVVLPPDSAGVVSVVFLTQPMPTCENPGPLQILVTGPIGVL